MTELATLKDRLRQVKKHYEEERARLWRGGRTVFPQIEHEERERDLRNEMRGKVREIRERAQQIHDEIVADSEYATELPIDSALTASEQTELSNRLSAARMDAAALSNEALEQRLRGVMKNGSDVEKAAYLLAARERDRTDRNRRAEREGREVYRGPATSGLSLILPELEESVLAEKRQEIRERIGGETKEASELLDQCYLAYHEAESIMGVHSRKYNVQRPSGVTTGGGGGRIADDRVT